MVEKAIAFVRSHPAAIACAIAVAWLLVRTRRARTHAR
jgi:hypothetical protein